jgi:hypothetical protein
VTGLSQWSSWVACVDARVARFFLMQNTQTGKMYQMATKNTQKYEMTWKIYIPNGNKIYQYRPLQDPAKCTQNGIFCYPGASIFLVRNTNALKRYQMTTSNPNGRNIFQMAQTYIPKFSGPKLSKIYPNCDFWYANIPSGNLAVIGKGVGKKSNYFRQK